MFNDRIKKEIEFWKKSSILQPAIKRGSRYIGMIIPIIREYGLPEEIALLPILESGYECAAISSAGALGCWQFMSTTGKDYGLNKTIWSDTRGDITEATRAACQHLKRLNVKYSDWSLTLAAYNYGQGNLDRALKRENTRDFWKLKTIPKETKDYVPKFYALVALKLLKQIEDLTLTPVKIKGVHSLRRIARILKIKTSELVKLNPSLGMGNTKPGLTMIYLNPAWNKAGLCAIGIADCSNRN